MGLWFESSVPDRDSFFVDREGGAADAAQSIYGRCAQAGIV